ncbi:hypothetical protein IOD16_23890 [Saccharothrix sp. 6-C]|uniref:hypothetical protein n=1 Tax=Saccharothrix sp. 6-C TaxID=2781735 RepID=UPI00191722EB|nr:hypothetical protein [Saccharothrix sp. 6-C]QQQ74235.1 hypothetical protein IOD16_23890 [Saccharothrix sp. 6-C]
MAAGAQGSPPGWVPVEHRVLGLDRRTFTPALVVLVVALALGYGLAALNAAIPWHNEVRAGDVLDLGDGATAVPPVGWHLESGTLVGRGQESPVRLQALLASGGATVELRGAAFEGTAEAFLDQVRRSQGDDVRGVSGSRATLTTDAGVVGVAQSATGPGGDGLDVAFKVAVGADGPAEAAPALLVRVRTAPGQFERYRGGVTALLRSITPGGGR